LATFGKEPELDTFLKRKKALLPGSIERALAVISEAHTKANLPTPRGTAIVDEVMAGIERTFGVSPSQKEALVNTDLIHLLSGLREDTLMGKRDKAILLLGWSGAFRREELVALNVSNLKLAPDGKGIEAFVASSKTDQKGKGKTKKIHISKNKNVCPVTALAKWIEAAQIGDGPLFRPFDPDGESLIRDRRLGDRAVARIVQRHALRAGLDPGENGFAGHSLRRGFVTTAKRAGKGDKEIMEVTGHKRVDTLYKYVQAADAFSEDSAGHGLLDEPDNDSTGS
jgi:integrase